jgi:hypothetical protein
VARRASRSGARRTPFTSPPRPWDPHRRRATLWAIRTCRCARFAGIRTGYSSFTLAPDRAPAPFLAVLEREQRPLPWGEPRSRLTDPISPYHRLPGCPRDHEDNRRPHETDSSPLSSILGSSQDSSTAITASTITIFPSPLTTVTNSQSPLDRSWRGSSTPRAAPPGPGSVTGPYHPVLLHDWDPSKPDTICPTLPFA